MPTPTIPAGNLFMNATTYTGNSSTQSIANGATGAAFQPDFVWMKNRSAGFSHYLNDSVRGPYQTLFSNSTSAEYNGTSTSDGVSTFNSNGFTLLNGTNADNFNKTGYNYVAWQWKAGGTAVSNTAGTITSSVSANTTSGFSIVSCNTTSGANTIGHGLGVAPSLIIGINRAAPNGWWVYHKSVGAGAYLVLNTTAASTTSNAVWNGVAPTSSVFSQGSGGWNNAATAIFYCWSEVEGYSKFGSYTGNGSADGPFIYTGFRPKFFMTKITSAAGYDWIIMDTSRDTYNVSGLCLEPNLSNAESTNGGAFSSQSDILSNGFKIRNSGTGANGNGGTYIYMAFAENPFKYANAR